MKTKSEFPFDKLPKFGSFPLPIYQGVVNEIVKVHKVPTKLAHYCALGLTGTLAQIHVDVKKPAGGRVGTGVYVVVQGSSGERKTKVDECLFGELRKPNKGQHKRHIDEVEAYKVREQIWMVKRKVLTKALRVAFADGKETDTIEAAICEIEKGKPKAPRETKLVFNDVSIEELQNKLDESPNATLLSSDGKKVLKNFLLRNDAVMNSFWSNEQIDVARVSARSYTLSDTRFSFSIMLQPDSLARIMMLDKGKEGRESGFFARVIFSDVGSTMGDRLIEIIEKTTPDLDDFNQRVAALLKEYTEAIAAGTYRRRLLEFSAEASRAWIAYFNYVESNIREDGRYEKAGDHASKLADNVARVAAGLHVLEGFEGEIGLDCLLSAIALCNEASKDYMEHLAPKNEDEIEAIALKGWLVDKYVSKRTSWIDLNQLLQFAPHRMRSAKIIHRYLEILERDEYLVVWPSGSSGRKKAQIELRMTRVGEARAKAPHFYDFSSSHTGYT